jgi:hypothetical protein
MAGCGRRREGVKGEITRAFYLEEKPTAEVHAAYDLGAVRKTVLIL